MFIMTLNAQNIHPSWMTARYLRTARSGNSSDQNSTRESWMDGLSDNEIMVYQNFALSAKIYPDKLNLLLKERLHSNLRRRRWEILLQSPFKVIVSKLQQTDTRLCWGRPSRYQSGPRFILA